MAHELLFTSAPRGLVRGSSGFCTVLASEGLPEALRRRLESLSGYRPVETPSGVHTPVAYAHWLVQHGGRRVSVLSRVAFVAADHSGRPSKIAHHVVLSPTEQPPAGPAWLLEQRGFMRADWQGEPRTVSQRHEIPWANEQPGAGAPAWARACGDPGWAGVLAERWLLDGSRAQWVIYDPETDPLELVAEAIALLPPERRWEVSFHTLFERLPAGTQCAWRFCVARSAVATKALATHPEQVIDLTKPLGKAPRSRYVARARGEVWQEPRGRKAPREAKPRREPKSRKARAAAGWDRIEHNAPPEKRRGKRTPPPPTRRKPTHEALVPEARRRERSPWLPVAAAALLLLLAFGANRWWQERRRLAHAPETNKAARRSDTATLNRAGRASSPAHTVVEVANVTRKPTAHATTVSTTTSEPMPSTPRAGADERDVAGAAAADSPTHTAKSADNNSRPISPTENASTAEHAPKPKAPTNTATATAKNESAPSRSEEDKRPAPGKPLEPVVVARVLGIEEPETDVEPGCITIGLPERYEPFIVTKAAFIEQDWREVRKVPTGEGEQSPEELRFDVTNKTVWLVRKVEIQGNTGNSSVERKYLLRFEPGTAVPASRDGASLSSHPLAEALQQAFFVVRAEGTSRSAIIQGFAPAKIQEALGKQKPFDPRVKIVALESDDPDFALTPDRKAVTFRGVKLWSCSPKRTPPYVEFEKLRPLPLRRDTFSFRNRFVTRWRECLHQQTGVDLNTWRFRKAVIDSLELVVFHIQSASKLRQIEQAVDRLARTLGLETAKPLVSYQPLEPFSIPNPQYQKGNQRKRCQRARQQLKKLKEVLAVDDPKIHVDAKIAFSAYWELRRHFSAGEQSGSRCKHGDFTWNRLILLEDQRAIIEDLRKRNALPVVRVIVRSHGGEGAWLFEGERTLPHPSKPPGRPKPPGRNKNAKQKRGSQNRR